MTDQAGSIGLLKDGKAAGPDGIPAEAIKEDIDTSTDMLYSLLGKIWQEEVVPADWKTGHLIKLPKKGDRRDSGNLSRNNVPISAREGFL